MQDRMHVHSGRAPEMRARSWLPADSWSTDLPLRYVISRSLLVISRWAASHRSYDVPPGRIMIISYNGIPASALTDVTWQKSQYSNPNGECVEVAQLPDGEIAVRNSRFPDGPALVYTRAEIAAFLAGAKDGEFDPVIYF